MKKQFVSLLISMLAISYLPGQNLVPNGDFEITFKKPCYNRVDGIYMGAAENWFAPTLGTSDWFHECGSQTWNGVPKNTQGWQNPQSGKAYAGIITFYKSQKNYREYVSVELTDALQTERQYCLRFYIALAKRSDCYTNRIGALLTAETPFTGNIRPLVHEPSLINTTMELKDTAQWMLFEQVYTAKGGEKFLTIGKFGKDQKDDIISLGEYKQHSYYYIDNVSLELVEEEQPSYK